MLRGRLVPVSCCICPQFADNSAWTLLRGHNLLSHFTWCLTGVFGYTDQIYLQNNPSACVQFSECTPCQKLLNVRMECASWICSDALFGKVNHVFHLIQHRGKETRDAFPRHLGFTSCLAWKAGSVVRMTGPSCLLFRRILSGTIVTVKLCISCFESS